MNRRTFVGGGLCFGAAAAPAPTLAAAPWRLILEDGGLGRVGSSPQAHSGSSSVLLEKTNGLGAITLERLEPVPVKPGRLWEVAIHTFLLKREYGVAFSLRCQDVDAAGRPLGPRRESSGVFRVPNFTVSGQWERPFVRWTTADEAVATRVSLRIEGNPMAILLDDFQTVENPPSLDSPGAADSREPPYDEQRALANLAKRRALPAKVEFVAQRARFAVGDEIRTSIVQQSGGGVPRHANFVRAGIHFQSVSFTMAPLVEDPEGFDWTKIRQSILRAVGADPEIQIILRINCNMPRSWLVNHPDHVWQAENGEKWILWRGSPNRLGNTLEEGEENFSASYGSPAYRRDMAAALRQLGAYLRQADVGKLVVGFVLTGGNDGQWYDNSQVFASYASNRKGFTGAIPRGPQLDHSPGHQEGFREWLREIYHNDVGALRSAWGDPEVSFETATVCSESARNPPVLFVTDRRVIDSNYYAQIAPARLVKFFASTLKEALGRPVFSMTYYPDLSDPTRLNKYALAEILGGPDRMDSVTEVHGYESWRKLGSTGVTFAAWGSHRLRGTAQVSEIDYRTYRSRWEGFWNSYTLAVPPTAEGSRAQLRRDVGGIASRGSCMWLYDIRVGSWDDENLTEVLAEAKRIMDWTHRPESPSPLARVAVFLDEEARRRVSTDRYALTASAVLQCRALDLSGVPYDRYLLDDIRHPNLPDYQVYIFLDAFTVNKQQAAAILDRCRRPGKVVVFPANLGIGSLDFPDQLQLAEMLTGIRCKRLPEGMGAASAPVADCTDPIAQNLSGTFIHAGKIDTPTLSPADPEAVVFGRYVDGNLPSHAIKRTSRGISILVTPHRGFGGLTPQLIHNIARIAGVRTLGVPGQVTFVGSGVAVCHRVQPGPATVSFEEPVDLIALDGATILARNVTQWQPDCDLLDTAAIFYRPARK